MAESNDYTTVPDGRYTVTIREVREGLTRHGDPRWSLALEVASGEHKGRLAAWDAIVWSHRGRSRARRVLRSLGVECDPTTRATDLIGLRAHVDIRRVTFMAEGSGVAITRSEVPYDGWTVAGGAS